MYTSPYQRTHTHTLSLSQIWHCLEQQQYLEATRLFLQARHTHTQLQVTLSKNSLLRRLWQSTSTFRVGMLRLYVGIAYIQWNL